jgi:hypothetical protein
MSFVKAWDLDLEEFLDIDEEFFQPTLKYLKRNYNSQI